MCCEEPVEPRALISPHYPTFFLLVCDFTGTVESQDGTKVGWTGVCEVIWFSQDSRHKRTLTALPFAQPAVPDPSEGLEIKLAPRGLLLH